MRSRGRINIIVKKQNSHKISKCDRNKVSPQFLCQIFVNSIEKERCGKSGVLIRFHKVMKLQSYKVLHLAQARHTRECIKQVTTGFLHIFYFSGENTSHNKVLRCFGSFFRNL